MGVPTYDDEIDKWSLFLEFIKPSPKYECAKAVLEKMKYEKEELMIKLYEGQVCMIKHHLKKKKKPAAKGK